MDIFRTTITKSPQETTRLGEEFGSLIVKSQSFGKTQDDPEQSRTGRKSKVKSGQDRGALTVCLYGDLGSGKTTFVQGVGKAFGIASRLLSPTFIIVRRYPVPEQTGFLYHIDLYRMEGEKDLLDWVFRKFLQIRIQLYLSNGRKNWGVYCLKSGLIYDLLSWMMESTIYCCHPRA